MYIYICISKNNSINENQEVSKGGTKAFLWHTTFTESLVCYTFILTTDAGNGACISMRSLLPAFLL